MQAAARLVPEDRAVRARRRNGVVDALDSVLKGARDVAGL